MNDVFLPLKAAEGDAIANLSSWASGHQWQYWPFDTKLRWAAKSFDVLAPNIGENPNFTAFYKPN